MRSLVVLTLVGLAAQLVDGSLGMAYGATSTSLLLVAGLTPAAASASVHMAEMGTTLVSGASHWRFGNVDWRIVVTLGLPGALGAFLGATALASLSTASARPFMAVVLLLIGLHLLLRGPRARRGVLPTASAPTRWMAPLGLVAGFVDASGGGGWGPLATPALLVSGRLDPRKVIGSVSAAEFLVTIAASVGFLLALGREGVPMRVVAALLVGGVAAAPFAAWLVRKVPLRALFPGVGGLLVLTNVSPAMGLLGVSAPARSVVVAGVVVTWVTAVAVALVRRDREPVVVRDADEDPAVV